MLRKMPGVIRKTTPQGIKKLTLFGDNRKSFSSFQKLPAMSKLRVVSPFKRLENRGVAQALFVSSPSVPSRFNAGTKVIIIEDKCLLEEPQFANWVLKSIKENKAIKIGIFSIHFSLEEMQEELKKKEIPLEGISLWSGKASSVSSYNSYSSEFCELIRQMRYQYKLDLHTLSDVVSVTYSKKLEELRPLSWSAVLAKRGGQNTEGKESEPNTAANYIIDSISQIPLVLEMVQNKIDNQESHLPLSEYKMHSRLCR